MDTSYYLYAGYLAFWLIPTVFLFRLTRKLDRLDEQLKN